MATNTFNVESINLSMRDFSTQVPGYSDPSGYDKEDESTWPSYHTANVYTLAGVTGADGKPRKMSIGQLVMAVCLSRATELEAKIVAEMAAMATTTDELESLSKVEADLAAWQKANPTGTLSVAEIEKDEKGVYSTSYPNLYATFVDETKRTAFLTDVGMSTSAKSWTADEVDELMQSTEKLMDSKNTMSQEQLIDIQSLTSKRDDTYSLISNVLKSLYTVMTGNVNNI